MSREIVVAALSRIAVFEGIDEAVLLKMAGAGRLAQVPVRGTVFRRGDTVQEAYVVLAGEIGLYRGAADDGGPEAVADSGSVLGTAFLLDGGTWPASGVALSNAILFSFGGVWFNQLAAQYGPLNTVLRQRLRRADALADLGNGPVSDSAANALPEELYVKKHTCPCCGALVPSCAVRSRFLRVTRTEPDFYQHYEGPNPLFYEVIVCEACGYAFDELDRESLNPAARKIARERCADAPRRGFGGPRVLEQAVTAYRRVLDCQEAVEARPSVRARTSLKLAWLYRYAGDEPSEHESLQAALHYYLQAFEREAASDAKHEIRLLYLIGELHRRLGERAKAVQWFGRVIGHPRKDANPQIVRMARDQWQDIRYQSRGEGGGGPGNEPG